ncbi:DUF4350 domain-containing protein [Methylotenera sp. N17]|uniref:DUF4350 domain-containing protein n=1 Tax=Methylotenera sp. N17 TaxID=1502761 RepID=UPI0009DD1032|nr:DUF4350 domain-containing protein [Methylotenera sp. N17]
MVKFANSVKGTSMHLHQPFEHWVMHTKSCLIVMLCLCLLMGYFSKQYLFSVDVTQNNRNSLSQPSISVLKSMPDAIQMTVFASKDDMTHGDQFRQSMQDFIARYQRTKPNISLNIFSTHENPALARSENITIDGEIVVKYQQQSMHIFPPINEERFTNLLLKLSHTKSRRIALLDAANQSQSQDNSDYLALKRALNQQGYGITERSDDLNAAKLGALILNTSDSLTSSKVTQLQQFIDQGGNLLWMVDDHVNVSLSELADRLGLKVSEAIIQQNSSQKISQVSKEVYANYYAQHPITQQFSMKTIFSWPHEINGQPPVEQGWKVTPLVLVVTTSDAEGQKASTVEPTLVPHHVVLTYERKLNAKVQRIVVVGDSHFLTSQSLSKGGNQQFVSNILQWLTFDATKVTIKPTRLKDVNMIVPEHSVAPKLIGYTIQYIIPGLLSFLTFYVLYRRRKR